MDKTTSFAKTKYGLAVILYIRKVLGTHDICNAITHLSLFFFLELNKINSEI